MTITPMPLTLRVVLAVTSGVMAASAFPTLGWWPMILLTWPLWFIAVRGTTVRQGVYLGLTQAMVFYGLGLTWLLHLFQHAAVSLWFVLATFLMLAGGLLGWVTTRHPRASWLPLYAALLCAALEFVRAEVFWLAFPWMTSGLGLGPTWLSPWIGVYGTGFLVLLAGSMLVLGGIRQRVAGAVLTILLAALGLFRPGVVTESSPGIPVLAVQSENCDVSTYLEMSAARPFSGGIILWPEYAACYDIQHFPGYYDGLEIARKLAETKFSTVIFGARRDLDDGNHYNEAITLEASGVIGTHDKNRPVHFMNDGLPGKTSLPIATRFGRIGTPICFDCDFADPVRRMTAAGAEAFAVPSMDAARWTARQHLQHAELFRHRALENNRWMVVCATSGLTQLIDPHGNCAAKIPMMTDGVLENQLHLRQDLTFFTRIGWVFPWVVCVLALVGTAVLCVGDHLFPCLFKRKNPAK